MTAKDEWNLPIAALAVADRKEPVPDLPMAFLPRLPVARTYAELLDRAVGWGRR